MARLNSEGQDEARKVETRGAAPQREMTSPSKGTGLLSTISTALSSWRSRRPANEEPPLPEEEEQGEQEADEDIDGAVDEAVAEYSQGGSDNNANLPPTTNQPQPAGRNSRLEVQINSKRSRDIYEVPDDIPPTKKLRSKPRDALISGRQLRSRAPGGQAEEMHHVGKALLKTSKKAKGKQAQTDPASGSTLSVQKKSGRLRQAQKEHETEGNTDDSNPIVGQGETSSLPEIRQDDPERIADLIMTESPEKNQPMRTKGNLAAAESKRLTRGSSNQVYNPPLNSAFQDDDDYDDDDGGVTRDADNSDDNGDTVEGDSEVTSQGDVHEQNDDIVEVDAPELDSTPLGDVNIFERMLTLANRAGCYKNDGVETFILTDEDRGLKSRDGKRMRRDLKQLKKAYQDLRAARDSGDDGEASDAQLTVTRSIKTLKDEVASIVEVISSEPDADEPDSMKLTKYILMDLYFNIIPQFIRVMIVSVRLNPLQKSMKTSAILEILVLVDTFFKLVNEACNLPPEQQPHVADMDGRYDTKSFKIQRPAIQLKPKIKSIREDLRRELAERKNAARAAATEKKRLVEQQKRLERDQLEKIEHRRKIRENHRLQREAYEEHRMFSDPTWAPLFRRSIQSDEEKRYAGSQSDHSYMRTNKATQHRQRQDEHYNQNFDGVDRDNDDEDLYGGDDDDVERVHGVFPSNNRKERNKQWTRGERWAFLELMQRYKGKDRYSRAAEVLNRSMDEVFEQAKEVQGAFDREHENGKFNEERDEWTYDVWVEQRPGS